MRDETRVGVSMSACVVYVHKSLVHASIAVYMHECVGTWICTCLGIFCLMSSLQSHSACVHTQGPFYACE